MNGDIGVNFVVDFALILILVLILLVGDNINCGNEPERGSVADGDQGVMLVWERMP
jgi:hypothetical protein